MSEFAIDVLLAFAVAVALLSALGLALMPNAWDRLHYTGPLSFWSTLAIVAAVVIRTGITSSSAVQALAVGAIVILGNPVVTQATGRALRIREYDELRPLPDEPVQPER